MLHRVLLISVAGPALLLVAAWPAGGPALVNVAPAAYGTTIVADTSFSEKFAGANVADGRIGHGDGWFSRDQTPLPCALTFAFAQPERVRRVIVHQAQWSGSMYHTKDYSIEASEDGKKWNPIAEGRLADDNGAQQALDVDVETMHLRVVVLTSYVAFQTCGFSEVEVLAERPVAFGPASVYLNGQSATISDDVCGVSLAHGTAGPQALIYGDRGEVMAAVGPNESADVRVPVTCTDPDARVVGEARLVSGDGAQVAIECGDACAKAALTPSAPSASVSLPLAGGGERPVALRVTGGPSAVRWSALTLRIGAKRYAVPTRIAPTPFGVGAPPVTPELRPAVARALIEWDWQAQDGIGTSRQAVGYMEAVGRMLERGRRLAREVDGASRMSRKGSGTAQVLADWRATVGEHGRLLADPSTPEADWAKLYYRMHWAKRALMLAHPLAATGPIVFAKQVPGCFSHQLTQYYGRYARPGGGVYVLDRPGSDMRVRRLSPTSMPQGSYMHPEVSWNADRVLFAFCQTDRAPEDGIQGARGHYYSLYSVRPDGSNLKRLTSGPYDDFSPRVLPNGKLVFISTRRGGWHRCGTPGCENYVLTVANADGSSPRPISFHETQEWDPAVLNDGRIAYTRWDYVDRHPVFYEHLWSTAPDGTRAAALFGNNTFNPIGIWEPRPVPGSTRIMATAAAHHAMTSGSIVLVDPSRGVDGPLPISRLTPDAPFPESETTVPGAWHAVMPGTLPYNTSENQRWPGHTYRSPFPLSERMFLAAYSFRELVGEPNANAANMFGLYLCDAYGNKELLYRDPNIASLWPVPLRKRSVPPVLPSTLDPKMADEGVFVLQDVYASLPQVPRGAVKALRIVQVLPKSTPGKDLPPIGVASGAPGKQVLGTVPVEKDGSAHFRAPARRELAFQALDQRGIAVQVMRSGTYLQPGEKTTCVGCHERRTTAPPGRKALAMSRAPSRIVPGPDGSRPLSYPIMVQTVLDRKCISCHSGAKPAGGVMLTGEPEGHYSRSYNALVSRVPFSDMNNGEALSKPGRFGAAGSSLMKLLLAGHQGVRLTPDETSRLATWMDVSALFYGTFDPADQERQRRGERIAGARLE